MSTTSTSPDKDYVDTIETFCEKNASNILKWRRNHCSITDSHTSDSYCTYSKMLLKCKFVISRNFL